jgi:hypothetical protein
MAGVRHHHSFRLMKSMHKSIQATQLDCSMPEIGTHAKPSPQPIAPAHMSQEENLCVPGTSHP